MATVDIIRNAIIDKLLTISDEEYLKTLLQLIENSDVKHEKVVLTKEQKLMLEMSEKDLLNGQIINVKSNIKTIP